MRNDDRKIIQAKIENGVVVPASLNDCLRQISEALLTLEGRKGPINLRDSVSLTADSTQTALAAVGPKGQKGRLEAAFRSTLGAELEVGQGTRHSENTRFATVTDPVSINFRPGQIDLQVDTGLTVGQAYVPTVAGSFFSTRPVVRVYSSVSIDIAAGSTDTITFDSETFDPSGMFTTATPTVININTAGFYVFGYSLEWASAVAANSVRGAFMRLNSSDTVRYGESQIESGMDTDLWKQNGTALESLPAGTTIQLRVFSTNNTQVLGVANTSPVLWAFRIP